MFHVRLNVLASGSTTGRVLGQRQRSLGRVEWPLDGGRTPGSCKLLRLLEASIDTSDKKAGAMLIPVT